MHTTQSYMVSPLGSLSTLSSLHGGYIPLSCEKDKNYRNNDDLNVESKTSKSRVCVGGVFSFLYRFLIAFLRLLCFRLPKNLDNESLLTVEYKNESKGEDLECNLMDDERSGFASTRNSIRLIQDNEHSVAIVSPHQHVERPKATTVTVNKIKASQVKGQVIALKGKDQMYKTRIAVSRSKQQLREVQDDMLNIRDNIQAAKKLFTEVEKGIQDYKWDSITREPWASLEYRGQVCYFPMSSSVKYLTPMDQMYIDHRIFVEEMKFHFKWKHGIYI